MICVWPLPVAVTSPLAETVATLVLSDDHVTICEIGNTMAES